MTNDEQQPVRLTAAQRDFAQAFSRLLERGRLWPAVLVYCGDRRGGMTWHCSTAVRLIADDCA